MYGYRPAEVGIRLGREMPDASFRVKKIRTGFHNNIRKPARVSLGCHVKGAACPTPDRFHGPSQLAGMIKRVATLMPPVLRLRGFKYFVKRFCEKHLQSLTFEPDTEFGFEEWISGVPYTESRKAELIMIHQATFDKKPDKRVKAFIKDEDYDDYKHLRGIYSRSDDFKCRVGPFFKKFGDKLFETKWFIKKIPVPDRPAAILSKLAGYEKIYCTDFSQYEATFVAELMKIEKMVYLWTLRNHGQREYWKKLFDVYGSTNKIDFKNFSTTLAAKRMSGEMNTSCGNGLMNLLITMYVLRLSGNAVEDVDAFFEGDDGIIGCKNLPTAQLYTEMGCNIKIEIPRSLSTASFCGNVFHPEVLHNVTNPLEVSVRFGYTGFEYITAGKTVKDDLLRSKGLSMLFEYPGCPIVKSLALYAIRCTPKTPIRQMVKRERNTYMREILMQALKMNVQAMIDIDIDDRTRLLVEELYQIPVQKQIEIEKYLDSLNCIQPLDLDLEFPRTWVDFYTNYSVELPERFSEGNHFARTGYQTITYMGPGQLVCFSH